MARSNSPASVDVDFRQLLADAHAPGTFDPDTVELIAYDNNGAPKLFDASRPGYEQYLLPWRIQPYYGITRVTLSFVMPSDAYTCYAVYFDTVERHRGKPDRYAGVVGNGDRFTDGYAKREINACGYDTWCDFDNDGDLDIFKGGTEPYVYVYENVGNNRFVERGPLTSGGEVMLFPHDGNNRSWLSVELCDWDGDGDHDLFAYFPTGPYAGHVARYENTTAAGGPVTFTDRGALLTQSGKALGSQISFVDFDGDDRLDVLGGRDGCILFYRNVGADPSIANMQLADGVYVQANGTQIELLSARVDCQDIDADGDLDVFVGTEEGRIYWFENVGTRTAPVFAVGRVIAFYEYMDARAGVKVADFNGDGLLDFVPGRYWERTQWGEQPRLYGRCYKNVGSATAPRFEARDAEGGCPHTQQFQIADAVRQNGVRAVDWDNDGRTDLVASDTDGFVWLFRNLTNHLFPVFAPGVKLLAGGVPLRVYGEEKECRAAGYARVDICDWNNDEKKDLLVADSRGWLTLFVNQGTDAQPVLSAGNRVQANGKPIDGTARGSVLVCDWDNDGLRDVIFGMVGEGETSQYYDWPHLNADPSQDRGFLFYMNTGTDAAPVLAYPKWIKAGAGGGTVISFTRPNLGDFVDWDGDGKKDFLACEFEHNVRFYKNTGPGGPNTEPRFESSSTGIYVVQPWTVQMISGADAVDFNRDGDIDIITGQGHGGGGLRFYERDFINDFVNENVYGISTWPVVTVGTLETARLQCDFDGDNDVDQEDFGQFQPCLAGDGLFPPAGCADADLDGDGDVDHQDLELFQACMGGAGLPPRC